MSHKEQFHIWKDSIANEIERMTSRVFFPRSYPEIDGYEEVFGASAITSRTGISHPSNPWFTRLTTELAQKWYTSEGFIQEAVNHVKSDSRINMTTNSIANVTSEMRKKTEQEWKPETGRDPGDSLVRWQSRMAEIFIIPLIFIRDASIEYSRTHTSNSKLVVHHFILQNFGVHPVEEKKKKL